MRIAVDVDGTLTRDTKQLKLLMKSLKDGGHFVSILTGSLNYVPSRLDRLAMLEGMKITSDYYDEVKIIDGPDFETVAKGKGAYCKKAKIDILFEDMDLYIYWVNQISPQTSTWLIRKFEKENNAR